MHGRMEPFTFPLIKFMQYINLYGDLPGLILVHIIYGIPITTLIFRNYYAWIGTEIIEAARIDGASLFGIYHYIFLGRFFLRGLMAGALKG